MADPAPQNWWIFKGPKSMDDLPEAPPWRRFSKGADAVREEHFEADPKEIEMVNAALYLRRPLLVTGKPGVGKTSLTYAVARELGLGPVLRWSITTQSTLRDGLYRYDALARLQDTNLEGGGKPLPIGNYLRLGPLGTAFAASDKPKVLLIDEIDKSDIDLPNDLLHIFEEGEFEIPELARLRGDQALVHVLPHHAGPKAEAEKDGIPIECGWVRCRQFPLVVMTSNGERDFPPAFLRRCLQLKMEPPERGKLVKILSAHLSLGDAELAKIDGLITDFLDRRNKEKKDLAADQLLNAVFLALKNIDLERPIEDREKLVDALWQPLNMNK